jgi:AcrR family transcriptional regulator
MQMSMPASITLHPVAGTESGPEEQNAKRLQILQGATSVFMSKGFDAASMGEIARTAGVSKGTLYVYFDDKEKLFEAIVQQACRVHAEEVFELDPSDHNVEAVLLRMGIAYATAMCRVEGLSSLRTVIAIADRMPDLGRAFYETGPAEGARKLTAYLDAQIEAGVLNIPRGETEIVATQFIDALTGTTFKPMLFNFDAPTPARIEQVVKIAIRAFLAAYKAK